MYEYLKTCIPLIGLAVGFSTFIVGTIQTKGIYFRPDSTNNKKFTIDGLNEFLIAPFCVGSEKFNTVWSLYKGLSLTDRIKLLQLNWIAMTGLGTVAATLIYLLL